MKVKHSKKKRSEVNKILELDNNPVREYLKNNPTKILSINNLQKNLPLRLKKRQIYYYCTNSNFIKRARPIEVGSGKHQLNIFKYFEGNILSKSP